MVVNDERQTRQRGAYTWRCELEDPGVQARDEATREAEEEKKRLHDEFSVQTEELQILQRQMMETREAPAARLAQLTSLLSAERTHRLAGVSSTPLTTPHSLVNHPILHALVWSSVHFFTHQILYKSPLSLDTVSSLSHNRCLTA